MNTGSPAGGTVWDVEPLGGWSLAGGIYYGGWALRVHSFTPLAASSLSLLCLWLEVLSPRLLWLPDTFLIDFLSETEGQVTLPTLSCLGCGVVAQQQKVTGFLLSDFAWCLFKAQCKSLPLGAPRPHRSFLIYCQTGYLCKGC